MEKNEFACVKKYRPAIMGFAALWIWFFHEWRPVLEQYQGLSFVESYIKRIGFSGVDIFFLLSGLGLTYSIGKTGVGQFYYRRLKRIILPFLLVEIVRFAFGEVSLINLIKNITGINFYFHNMYDCLWFIPAITTFYLLFPLIWHFFKKVQNKTLFMLIGFQIWLILSMCLQYFVRSDLYGMTNRIPVFMLGIYLGWLSQNKEVVFSKSMWVLIFTTFIGGALLSYFCSIKNLIQMIPEANCSIPTLMLAICIVFILSRALERFKVLRLFEIVFTFYGGFSLEFYCVQEWLGQHLNRLLGEQYSSILSNLIDLFIATVIGWLLHLLFTLFWKGLDHLLFKPLSSKIDKNVETENS